MSNRIELLTGVYTSVAYSRTLLINVFLDREYYLTCVFEKDSHRAKTFSAFHAATVMRQLGMHRRLGGDTVRTGDPKWPKGVNLQPSFLWCNMYILIVYKTLTRDKVAMDSTWNGFLSYQLQLQSGFLENCKCLISSSHVSSLHLEKCLINVKNQMGLVLEKSFSLTF